jgi:transcriptional regulator with XRE-family HTH domain
MAEVAESDIVPLQAVLARNAKEARKARGWSQDHVASRAVRLGLPWSRSTVADAEAQRRAFSVDELVLLPLVLEVEMSQLLGVGPLGAKDPDSLLLVGFAETPVKTLLRVLSNMASLVAAEDLPRPRFDPGVQEAAEDAYSFAWSELNAYNADPTHPARREAERHLARKLNEHPVVVSHISKKLWGRHLSEERDRRVSAATGKGDMRTRRGHITRELHRELRDSIENPDVELDLFMTFVEKIVDEEASEGSSK